MLGNDCGVTENFWALMARRMATAGSLQKRRLETRCVDAYPDESRSASEDVPRIADSGAKFPALKQSCQRELILQGADVRRPRGVNDVIGPGCPFRDPGSSKGIIDS